LIRSLIIRLQFKTQTVKPRLQP